jgi:hypothetical protein
MASLNLRASPDSPALPTGAGSSPGKIIRSGRGGVAPPPPTPPLEVHRKRYQRQTVGARAIDATIAALARHGDIHESGFAEDALRQSLEPIRRQLFCVVHASSGGIVVSVAVTNVPRAESVFVGGVLPVVLGGQLLQQVSTVRRLTTVWTE